MMFKSSGEVYAWLCSFINLERGPGGKPGEHLRLDRIRRLAEIAGRPDRRAPVIHIAGSKGKGSLTAMISAVLEAAGKRPGRYMSPHVRDWRERICLGGAFFPEEIYARAGNELRAVYEEYRYGGGGKNPARRDGAENLFEAKGPPPEPTFFELTTLYFFLCGRLADCDFFVVETGLGGRLDATNIVDPLISVITVIEKEHTEYLGNDLETIAGEKAGIIKHKRPLILAPQNPASLTEVFRAAAREKEAPFFYLPDLVRAEKVETRLDGTSFILEFDDPEFAALSSAYKVPVPGQVQAINAAAALAAAKMAFPALDAETAKAGLAAVRLPARFERISFSPKTESTAADTGEAEIILDGAHTPGSVGLCAQTFCDLYGKGGILLFGCAKGKDVKKMAEILLPCFSLVIITAPGTFKTSDPEEVYRMFLEISAGEGGLPETLPAPLREKPPLISLIAETPAAIQEALKQAGSRKKPLLVCGSFYLAGEIGTGISAAALKTAGIVP